MAFPVIQQSATGTGTTSFAAVPFTNPNGRGNGILVGVSVISSGGSTTEITVTDNNSNIYSPVSSLIAIKNDVWQLFQCTNPKLSPNATLSIIPSATFSGGSLAGWAIVQGEWNTVLSTDMVMSVSSSPAGFNASTTFLLSQPAGTTAVGFSFNTNTTSGNFGSHVSGPPPWTFRAVANAGGATALLADSENFPAGTVTFTDTGVGFGGVILVTLAPPGISPYSVPDCRNYATFPNASRIVNMTKTYDVQISSNSAVPGTDSRKAGAPVDCRIAPNIPENSRTPGTFGPGE